MSGLKDHALMLRDFLRTDFRKIFLWCVAGMLAAVCLGFIVAKFSPDLVDIALSYFTQMVEDAGVVDDNGGFSVLGLLGNNWLAMLMAALYGFIPFLFLPAFSLAVNGILIGILAAWYHMSGMSMLLYLSGILPHGICELPALLLSVACGICLCRNMCLVVTSNPKRVPMVELLSDLLRVMLLMVFPLTVAAAFLEAYVTPLVMNLFL